MDGIKGKLPDSVRTFVIDQAVHLAVLWGIGLWVALNGNQPDTGTLV